MIDAGPLSPQPISRLSCDQEISKPGTRSQKRISDFVPDAVGFSF